MEYTDVISTVKDVMLGISAIGITVFAWIGLKTWRKELTGKAKLETARNLMRLSLKFQANLEGVRFPITQYFEYANRTKQDGESASESSVLNEWYAKANRINAVFENLTEIVEVQWEAEVLFNESSVQSIEKAVKSYRESYADLSSAIASYFEIIYDEARTGNPYNNQEWLRELRKTISSDSIDDFSMKVDDATNKLSSSLKKYMR